MEEVDERFKWSLGRVAVTLILPAPRLVVPRIHPPLARALTRFGDHSLTKTSNATGTCMNTKSAVKPANDCATRTTCRGYDCQSRGQLWLRPGQASCVVGRRKCDPERHHGRAAVAGAQPNAKYRGCRPRQVGGIKVMLGILRGSLVYSAHLARETWVIGVNRRAPPNVQAHLLAPI